jgi:hypothetical protein
MLDLVRALISHRLLVLPKIRAEIPVERRQRVRDATRAVFIWINFFSDLLNIPIDYGALTQYALLIPKADDLVDENGKEITVEYIYKNEVAQEMIKKARSPRFKDILFKAIKAQSESLRQKQNLSKEELERITFEKGGLSMLLALHFIKEPTDDEEKLFYFLGSALQVFDDFQDQDIDKKEGINTLFTTGYYNVADVNRWLKDYEYCLTQVYGIKATRLILFTRFSVNLAKFHSSRFLFNFL